VEKAAARAPLYFSSRRFIFFTDGQTLASSANIPASSTCTPASRTRARTRAMRSAPTSAST
jgi:hypothetical protein